MRRIASILSLLALVPLAAAGGCSDDNQQSSSGDTGGGGGAGGAGGAGGGSSVMSDEVRAAIFIGSCIPDDGVNRWIENFYTERSDDPLQNFPAKNVACFKDKANGCQAVEECLGVKAEFDPASCMPACNGDVFTVCDDQLKITADCAKIGATCSATEQNCVIEPLGPTCDFSTFMESCQNGVPLVCSGEHETKGPDCAKYGLTCGESNLGGAPGNFGCIGTGPKCEATGASSLQINYDEGVACNGAKLRACINGFEQEVDCATLGPGLTCQTGPNGAFCGLGTDCQPGGDSTCEGTTLVVCNAGRTEKFDCKTLGFTSCNAQFGTCGPSVYDTPMP